MYSRSLVDSFAYERTFQATSTFIWLHIENTAFFKIYTANKGGSTLRKWRKHYFRGDAWRSSTVKVSIIWAKSGRFWNFVFVTAGVSSDEGERSQGRNFGNYTTITQLTVRYDFIAPMAFGFQILPDLTRLVLGIIGLQFLLCPSGRTSCCVAYDK